MTSSKRRLLFLVALLTFALLTIIIASGAVNFHFLSDDADLPSGKVVKLEVDKEDFMTRRAEGLAEKRGIHKDAPFDPQARPAALQQMELQEQRIAAMGKSHAKDALLAPWIPRTGPNSQRPNANNIDAGGGTHAFDCRASDEPQHRLCRCGAGRTLSLDGRWNELDAIAGWGALAGHRRDCDCAVTAGHDLCWHR